MTHTTPTLIEKLTVAMIGMFAFLQVYSVQAILPIIINDLHASEVQAGLAVGATVMAIALVSPFTGMLSDAFGRKRFIVGSLLLLSMPTALISQSQSIDSLIIWRFLQGLSVPGITVVLIAYIGEEYPKHLTKMTSLYVMGTVFGGFGGRFLAGHLHEIIGWRTAYEFMGVLTLLGAGWVLKALPKSAHFQRKNIKNAIAMLATHAKNRHVISAGLLGSCVLFSLVGVFTFINLHLSEKPYQLSASALANIFTLYLIGMVITPLTSKLVTHFGMTNAITGAVICSMMGVVLTLSTPLWLVILGLIILSSGVFVTQSATLGYLNSHVNQGRSLASGLYYMSYYAGGSVGAWLCGLAYASGQWTYTVIAVGLVQMLALAVVFLFIKRH